MLFVMFHRWGDGGTPQNVVHPILNICPHPNLEIFRRIVFFISFNCKNPGQGKAELSSLGGITIAKSRHTTTTTPLPPHHYHHTTTTTPLPPHHYHHTTTTTPLLPHHYHHTTTTTPLPHVPLQFRAITYYVNYSVRRCSLSYEVTSYVHMKFYPVFI